MGKRDDRASSHLKMSPAESEICDNLIEEIRNRGLSRELDNTLDKYLGSHRYSSNFKAKLALATFDRKQMYMWGFENFNSQNLSILIGKLRRPDLPLMNSEEMFVLLANPDFISSRGGPHDVFTKTVRYFACGTKIDANVGNLMLGQLLSENRMSLPIAEAVIEANNLEVMGSKKAKPEKTLDEAPIIAWAKKTYDLDGSPDRWIYRLLFDEATKERYL